MAWLVAGILAWFASGLRADEAKEIRLGHFPNISHAQGILAHATGEYEKKLGVPIRWSVFNAGPTAIEALLVGAIDAAYVGPNPALNGYIKTRGEGLRIIAGGASGGAALVVRADTGITSEKDFVGKIVATPQLGNTQDVAARAWFLSKGYKLKEQGGNLTIIPLSHSDQLLLFQKKEIDAAWTIEPWVSFLEQQAKGRVFLEENILWPNGRYVTVHLIVSAKFLRKNPGLTKKLLQAHVEITQKINRDKKVMGQILNREIGKLTSKELPVSIFESAWKRVEITWDPVSASLKKSAEDSFKVGFFQENPDLSGIYDLSLLNAILKEKGLPAVQ